ncbi:uncharacterized protein BDZ99DRAFT_452733 [Mytilinidion resinicola]|uniref:Anaphase-promoting complex subunit 2 n=1 Tax=Mytilinidion resinicola TaxID=574789 RepID=A0A6A6Y4I4_9PEZI|nr:uncharacterized protein BDZ99DRAFT_452733 [Mytilinidion resinicola]KAF2803702.1 hypothetical protein BDZ99DRAFT_452733 [Mytilinidion resinicola]
MDHQSLVFASVFPVPALSHTTPTPIATPELGFTAPGQSFGGPFGGASAGSQHREVKRNLAWSTATRFLSLPKLPHDEGHLSARVVHIHKGKDVVEALEYLLVGEGQGEEGKEESLVDWYTNEVRIHFVNYVHPALRSIWDNEIACQNAWEALEETQRILLQVQQLYLQPFNNHILPILEHESANTTSSTIRLDTTAEDQHIFASWKFQRDLHGLFAHALPPQRFSKTLSYVLYNGGCRLFRVYVDNGLGFVGGDALDDVPKLRNGILQLLRGLQDVGLGGEQAQKAFAHAMDKLMGSFIVSHYMKVDWFSRKSIINHLRQWVKDGFSPLVRQVMEVLADEPKSVQANDVQQWQDMAIGRLGRARVENLFDFIINWDKSLGAILDIKEYLKMPGAKVNLSNSFSQQVSRRLLHAGATTTFILNVYIYVIRAFNELEPNGVLLERAARPIRRYLKGREDTARIVISSLLTDVEDENAAKFGPTSEISHEIAAEMQKPIASFAQEQDDDLNWSDMNWQPHPMDASPDYRKSKVEDVIWFLLTLYDREDFINELKQILGDYLLRGHDPEYEKETRLLELIKLRLGDDKLQACEVMLRDVLESNRINASINGEKKPDESAMPLPITPSPHTPANNQAQPRTPAAAQARYPAPSTPVAALIKQPPAEHTLNAQILSSFFWPPLREDEFHVPAPIATLQREYEARFERVKGMRKLRWLPSLGRAKVELHLTDRTVDAEVQTWQASVIYAFQALPAENRNSKAEEGVARAVPQLVELLEMDEGLVRNALVFWVGMGVLQEVRPDVYAILETLPKPSAADITATDTAGNPTTSTAVVAAAAAAAAAELQPSGVVSTTEQLAQNKPLYRQFVMGMLTNQGNMPPVRVLMMLKMVVPGGFPYGVEEVRALLEELVEEGKVGGVGDVFGVRK